MREMNTEGETKAQNEYPDPICVPGLSDLRPARIDKAND